jgi:hypothetical protein
MSDPALPLLPIAAAGYSPSYRLFGGAVAILSSRRCSADEFTGDKLAERRHRSFQR